MLWLQCPVITEVLSQILQLQGLEGQLGEMEGHSFRERQKVSAELLDAQKSPGKTGIKISSFSSPLG